VEILLFFYASYLLISNIKYYKEMIELYFSVLLILFIIFMFSVIIISVLFYFITLCRARRYQLSDQLSFFLTNYRLRKKYLENL
jgi:hypothetical protein